jgi:hypothetical protein
MVGYWLLAPRTLYGVFRMFLDHHDRHYVIYYALLIDRRVVDRQMLLKWVMISILSFLILTPLYLPYHEIKQKYGLS